MKGWRGLLRPVICLVLCVAMATALAAGNTVDKFALVIGNQSYPGKGRGLVNTQRDAELMAQSLKKLGFAVTQRLDLTRSQMLSEVASFAEQLTEGSTALVYYAGHGMQVGGNNYLVPVDMLLTSEQTVPLKAYPLKTLLERLSASKAAVNVVVLDACRDNPFQPPSPVRYRNFADLGLASIQAPRGTLVAFSTAPGQLAADGKEANSIYTSTLASVMVEPKLEIREIFEKVAGLVRKRTLDDQIPWYETSLTDKYFFLPPEGVTVVAGKPLQMADAGRRDAQGRRGVVTAATPVQWFHNLSNNEWNQLDWEIQQRVRRLTADEIPRLEHQASSGSVVHQTTLGLAYKEGVDKAVDPSTGKVTRYNASNRKALDWLHKAADAGFPVAQVELGEMYYAGHGVDRDLAESQRWIEKAASVDYTRAKLDLIQLRMTANPKDATGFGDVVKEVNRAQAR
jgi:hypothetical protein